MWAGKGGETEATCRARWLSLLLRPLGPPGIGPPARANRCSGIFTNLGTRRAGEASAYSIFNRGVQRLPGQLDAGEIDRQMRQGQM
ncbi:hypothetical protein TSOC_000321 [Tetrabaena socialis]|uniref:SAYSvFN domain-containing protein n=1 Tax=Tetrabaena socialis TaxID=47790 RepID=A0A2J8AJT4_9CHLO|nr:hypothetical protein TSOC_000321 [Tetrabaena socialis]|eukprot:PNH12785.1 hypothetical protein TSOC_000321 [Tetrabaena socialis]